jgi:hypothetical protein
MYSFPKSVLTEAGTGALMFQAFQRFSLIINIAVYPVFCDRITDPLATWLFIPFSISFV